MRRICFVTGTRAEYGLMRNVLRTISNHPKLKLQIIATGMHLDPAHGDTLATIRQDGWSIDHVVPWPAGSGEDRAGNARNTGLAVAGLTDAFRELASDVVLVVGDRVEAFAAATAAHLSGLAVAHVHGGDRAVGQVDDALRHAITKLAHVHFPATRRSAQRLKRLGEDAWRIRQAGSPGLDGIESDAVSRDVVAEAVGELAPRRYALLLLHPVDADEAAESRRARLVLRAVASVPYERIVIVYPNNDPGAGGIIRAWETAGHPNADDRSGPRGRARLLPSRASALGSNGDTKERSPGDNAGSPLAVSQSVASVAWGCETAKRSSGVSEAMGRPSEARQEDLGSRQFRTTLGSAGASPSRSARHPDDRLIFRRDVPRPVFLALMRDAAVLVGNSSSGIIEAASFGTPVVDIGPRQKGRERGRNVVNVPYEAGRIRAELSRLWNGGMPRRFTSANIYGSNGVARRIALALASVKLDDRLLRKLIAY